MDLVEDPRFVQGIAAFNAEEFREAADAFEDLFFEYTLAERELARGLMQLAVGCLHLSLRQQRPAIERLNEAGVAFGSLQFPAANDLGLVVKRLVASAGEPKRSWPRLPASFR